MAAWLAGSLQDLVAPASWQTYERSAERRSSQGNGTEQERPIIANGQPYSSSQPFSQSASRRGFAMTPRPSRFFRNLFRKPRVEQELNDELCAYVEMAADEKVA